MNITAIPCV